MAKYRLYRGGTMFDVEEVNNCRVRVITYIAHGVDVQDVVYMWKRDLTEAIATDAIIRALTEPDKKEIKVFDYDSPPYFCSDTCIYCGNGNVEGGSLDLDGDRYVQNMTCTDCGGMYEDTYLLRKQRPITIPTEAQIAQAIRAWRS